MPHVKFSLEQYIEFLAEDELLEVTPKSLRVRKAILNNQQRALKDKLKNIFLLKFLQYFKFTF